LRTPIRKVSSARTGAAAASVRRRKKAKARRNIQELPEATGDSVPQLPGKRNRARPGSTAARGRNLLQVLVMMTGFWLTQNIITIFIPTTLLLHMLKLPNYALTSTFLISYAALFFSYIASGMFGQRIGRRRFFVIADPLIAVIGSASSKL
jgi:Na+/melibiose symporter-like transporter